MFKSIITPNYLSLILSNLPEINEVFKDLKLLEVRLKYSVTKRVRNGSS